jgi:hypothetical protein
MKNQNCRNNPKKGINQKRKVIDDKSFGRAAFRFLMDEVEVAKDSVKDKRDSVN